MTLDSPGMFVLDTACIPDVLGLRTRYPDTELVKVREKPGRMFEC